MTQKLRVLDLFSGIGGFSLGLERTGGFETVAFCEIEEFPRRVLAKHWPEVPCFQDVRKLRGEDVGHADVIVGGYPCQPFSTAGKRRGQEDDRHLWPEFNRLVAELRPTWVIGENVAGHISMGLDNVLSDLEREGYAARTFVIPACAVGAPHRRDRTWTLAYAQSERRPEAGRDSERSAQRASSSSAVGNANGDVYARELDAGSNRGAQTRGQSGNECKRKAPFGERIWAELSAAGENVADAISLGQQRQRKPVIASNCEAQSEGEANNAFAVSQPGKWCPEPAVGRVAHGVPNRVDRLKALGNAVVPQIPEMIGRAILEAEGLA